jgi:CysZ protein
MEDGSEKKAGVLRSTAGDVARAGRGAGRSAVRAVRGFWWGFRQPFRGARFAYFSHPGLARIWIWPIVITLACLVGVAVAAFLWHDDLFGLMWSEPVGETLWAKVQRVLRPVAQVLFLVLLAAIGILIVNLLSSLFAAPFKDLLSEEVERIHRQKEAPPFSWDRLVRDLLLSVRLELGKSALYVAIMVPSFLLSLLVPVLGQVVYTIFGYLLTIVFFAVDYTDWPLARRGRGVRERVRILRRNFVRMLGLGTGVWLFVFIPFVGLFFMPAAVTGGTLLVLDLEADGDLEEET